MTSDYVVRAVSAGIKIVVRRQQRRRNRTRSDGSVRVHRYVSERSRSAQGERKGYVTTHVFRARPAERVAHRTCSPEFRGLARSGGFDIAAFDDQTEDAA